MTILNGPSGADSVLTLQVRLEFNQNFFYGTKWPKLRLNSLERLESSANLMALDRMKLDIDQMTCTQVTQWKDFSGNKSYSHFDIS